MVTFGIECAVNNAMNDINFIKGYNINVSLYIKYR